LRAGSLLSFAHQRTRWPPSIAFSRGALAVIWEEGRRKGRRKGKGRRRTERARYFFLTPATVLALGLGWCRQREKSDWQEGGKFDCRLVRTIFFVVPRQFSQDIGRMVGWCREREKIDWQEHCKFDCRLGRTIFIFCCPLSIFPRRWRVARKSNFDSSLDLFLLSWRRPNGGQQKIKIDRGQ